MAPTQELDESFVYNPQLSLDPNGDIEFLPLLLQEITPPRVEELVPIDPYSVDEVPYLPNLQRILRNATGSDNLAEVTQLKLRVIAQDVGLHRIYVHMPVLRELILDGSELTSLRDLGCGLKTLKQLRVNRCGLTSLDGIMGVENIEEFYGAFNLITDITPCAALEFIKKIDLKKNFLQDVGCLSFLSICPQLEHIILDENPNISNRFDYRELVKRYIPQLKSLDDAEYPEEEPIEKPEPVQGSSSGKDELPHPILKTKPTSNCTYSVSFSPRVLTPRSDTSESSSSGSCDIKVVKNSAPDE